MAGAPCQEQTTSLVAGIDCEGNAEVLSEICTTGVEPDDILPAICGSELWTMRTFAQFTNDSCSLLSHSHTNKASPLGIPGGTVNPNVWVSGEPSVPRCGQLPKNEAAVLQFEPRSMENPTWQLPPSWVEPGAADE